VHALAVLFIFILLGNQFGWRWLLSQLFSSKKNKVIEAIT